MQTTDVKVPVTRVTKVSEMRTLQDIPDNAVFMVAYDRKGYKTPFNRLKKLIADEAERKILHTVDNKMAALQEALENNIKKTDDVKAILDSNIAETKSSFADTASKISSIKESVQQTLSFAKSEASQIKQAAANTQASVVQLFQQTDGISSKISNTASDAAKKLEEAKRIINEKITTVNANAESSLAEYKKQESKNATKKTQQLLACIDSKIADAVKEYAKKADAAVEELKDKISKLSDAVKQLLDEKEQSKAVLQDEANEDASSSR